MMIIIWPAAITETGTKDLLTGPFDFLGSSPVPFDRKSLTLLPVCESLLLNLSHAMDGRCLNFGPLSTWTYGSSADGLDNTRSLLHMIYLAQNKKIVRADLHTDSTRSFFQKLVF